MRSRRFPEVAPVYKNVKHSRLLMDTL